MAPRVVVVGGGVLGCCAAYQLAKAGARTTLIERDAIAAHASGRNPGNLNPILATQAELVPLALASFQLHLSLAKELAASGCDPYAMEPVSRILVAFNTKDRDELNDIARRFAGYEGFATTWLDEAQLRRIDRRLSPAVTSGLLIEGNRSLDSRAFNIAVAAGAQKAGAEVVRATVRDLTRHGRAVSIVHTDAGDHPCDMLVLATGPWVAEFRNWLGIDLEVEPVKGEMLRLRFPEPNITHDFTHGMISLYRRGDDEVWVGVTRESCGFDERPTDHGRLALIEGAAQIMPAVRDATTLEHLAALRPMTRSGLPVVGAAAGWDNVFVANGGGIKGVLLSTGIGMAIRDLVMTGTTRLPLAH